MIEHPIVSVIIPAFNCGKYISRALESVLTQTFKSFECIVVDDGSTDNTADIVRGFSDRVKYVYQENSGASSARNKGISLSKGEYIAFLDADDYWVKTKLKSQIAVFSKYSDVALVYTNVAFHGASDNADILMNQDVNLNLDCVTIIEKFNQLFDDPYLRTPSVIVKTELVRDIGGFDTSLVTAEDLDFYFRYCWGKKYAKIDQILVYIDRLEGSLGLQLRSYQDNLYVIDQFIKKYPVFEKESAALIKSKRLYIHGQWVDDLLYYGLGSQARAVLKLSKEYGTLENYYKKVFKSVICFYIAKIKNRKP